MIVKTKQDWTIGKIVKVDFLTLRVLGVTEVKNFCPDIYLLVPDIYILESLDGKRRYDFTPHNGLVRTN